MLVKVSSVTVIKAVETMLDVILVSTPFIVRVYHEPFFRKEIRDLNYLKDGIIEALTTVT